MKISSATRSLKTLIELQRPAFLWGAPGIGKSDLVQATANELGAELSDVRMNLLDPVDMKGFPVPDIENNTMRWLPANFLPPMKVKKGTKFVDNNSRGILFLDEMNSALPATQAAGYQLILNRRIGNYVLPKNWAIVAAGNRDGDRGVTHRMPSPLANRLVHIDIDVDVDDWSTWALQNGIKSEVIAFMRFRPGLLHDFKPNENPRAFPSPRSWAFVNQIYKSALNSYEEFELIKGTVGEGAAGEFKAFTDVLSEMPSIDKILSGQEQPVPEKPAVKYAVVSALAMKTTETNIARVLKYVEKMEIEFQVVLVRFAGKVCPAAMDTKAFDDWGIKNSKVLL